MPSSKLTTSIDWSSRTNHAISEYSSTPKANTGFERESAGRLTVRCSLNSLLRNKGRTLPSRTRTTSKTTRIVPIPPTVMIHLAIRSDHRTETLEERSRRYGRPPPWKEPGSSVNSLVLMAIPDSIMNGPQLRTRCSPYYWAILSIFSAFAAVAASIGKEPSFATISCPSLLKMNRMNSLRTGSRFVPGLWLIARYKYRARG